MPNAPKVFVSHATEDKAVFVLPFATALRAKGIDAWVDEWEILPGDSLVQKIFEEGIRDAGAVVIILSKVSVTKKWVREELDAAVVARIGNATRLIPIVIDDCEVPIVLRATKWVRADVANFGDAVDEVVRAVFSQSNKPPLGSAPAYTRNPTMSIPGIDSMDSQILLELGRMFIEAGGDCFINKENLITKSQEIGLNEGQVDESLEILAGEHYIEGVHALGGRFLNIKLLSRGVRLILGELTSNFEENYRQISAYIVNYANAQNDRIAEVLELPPVVVNHVIDDLNERGLIKNTHSLGGQRQIYDVSAQLKRSLR